MRAAGTVFAVLWFIVMGLAVAGLACGGGGAADPASATPDLRATIDAVLARAEAERAAETAGTPSSRQGATVPATPVRIPQSTPSPAPDRSAAAPSRPSPAPLQPTAPAAGPAAYDLSEVRNWEYAEQAAPAAAARIRSVAWIADGLQTADEFNAAEALVNIGIDAPATLAALLDAHSVGSRLGPMDLPALLSLQRMAQDRPERLAQLTAADWFRDGLTETEGAIVAALYERSRFLSPEFDDIVHDPGAVRVEMGSATRSDGVDVPIAVIRDARALAPDSPIIAVAQLAVPLFEEMFEAPFPTPAVVFHITPYVAGAAAGTNYQTHITLKPEIDANEQPDFAPHAVFHEIAHYYLYARPGWYAEGGADFAASYAQWAMQGRPAGRPPEATNSPCAAVDSLSELERRLPNDARGDMADPDLWHCNYALGERLMLALYRQLGEERFLEGWRALYGILAGEPEYPSQRDFTESDLRVAWLRAGGMTGQPALEHIWDQWYRGAAGRAIEGTPDGTPADASLPGINGRIDRAYVALAQDGAAVESFSADEARGFVYLTLEYSYALTGSPQELKFEVVEYYEDGFTTGRRKVTIPVESQYAGGTQWVSVGPSPPRSWAPGRYWVYVYESGRKVAEAAFTVTQ